MKKTLQSGGMGIIMLHGVGGDYFAISAAAHQQLLDFLKKNEDQLWIVPFQQAMDYARTATRHN